MQDKQIRKMVTGLALSLPLLTAVGSMGIQRGAGDGVLAAPDAARAPVTDPQRPDPAIRAGVIEPSIGVPCRRSAGERPELTPLPRHVPQPNSGCNLRLVKRRPADPAIWA